MRKKLALLTVIICCFCFFKVSAQTAPPTLQSVEPSGAQRGRQVTLTLTGTNIDGISKLIFSEPGFTAKISDIKQVPMPKKVIPKGVVVTSAPIEDKAKRYKATILLSVSPAVPQGVHFFRVQTPLGVSNLLPFAIGSLPEILEHEPDSSETPQKILLPATIVGSLNEAGDVDAFQFRARAGDEIVFQTVARSVNSQVDAVLRLADSQRRFMAESNTSEAGRDPILAYRFSDDGTYTLSIEDAEHRGGRNYHYRIHSGALPYITEVFPLGVQRGATTEIRVKGFNLGKTQKVKVTGNEEALQGKTIPISAQTPTGLSINRMRIALGNYPEIFEKEPNDDLTKAQQISVPCTVNGRIAPVPDPTAALSAASAGTLPVSGFTTTGAEKPHAASLPDRPDQDLYQFHARKGQTLILEVMAQQLGSPLDSILEIVHPDGTPIPRATVRCIAQTTTALRDHDSATRGIRLSSWTDFSIDDYVMIGDEILQIESMPTHPDADMIFRGFRGSRVAFFGTTPRNHALNSPVYKVEIHPPGKAFPTNGMPVFHLNYENDDSGPMFGGKDSRLNFTAPEDGDYIVKIRDVRDIDGERFLYRLSVHEPAPDYDLTFDPKSFNIPKGGRVSLTVTATRRDGYDGPIEVELLDLPPALKASRGIIPSGENTTALTLTAGDDASLDNSSVTIRSMYPEAPGNGAYSKRTRIIETLSPQARVPGVAAVRLVARARIGDHDIVRQAEAGEPISVVALAPGPDLVVRTEAKTVHLVAGQSAAVTVKIERHNGLTARVPISVMNLPHGVRVDDIGLNGIMITEDESSRTFHIVAEPWVAATSRQILVVGLVEVNSPLRNEAAAEPVQLVIEGRTNGRRADQGMRSDLPP
ncbi:MAG TPA: hypothetical protein VGL91_07345 [Acidobacteriota bacterium]